MGGQAMIMDKIGFVYYSNWRHIKTPRSWNREFWYVMGMEVMLQGILSSIAWTTISNYLFSPYIPHISLNHSTIFGPLKKYMSQELPKLVRKITQIPMKFNKFMDIPMVEIQITKIPIPKKKDVAMNPQARY